MPKVLLTGAQWFGDLLTFCERGLQEAGAEVQVVSTNQAKWKDGATRFRRKVARVPIIGARVDWHLSQRHRKQLHSELQQTISNINKQWQPDILLSILCWGEPITAAMLDGLSGSRSVVRVAWLMDDPFLHDGTLAGILNLYDHIYVVDGAWCDPIQLLTGRPVTEMTCGADLPIYHPIPVEKVPEKFRCNLAFVGSSYQGNTVGQLRQKLLGQVADLGLHIYGDQGWQAFSPNISKCFQGSEIDSQEANLAYNGAAIALNIHHPQFRIGTSLRTFAIAASGAFQLVDWRSGLDRFLIPNEEIVTYRTPDEIREQALYYLANPIARDRIARAGYERVRREHTYAHRLAQMLRDTDLLPSNAKVSSSQIAIKAQL